MRNRYTQFGGALLTGAVVLTVASVVALAGTVGRIAVTHEGGDRPGAPATRIATPSASATRSPGAAPVRSRDGGEICRRFSGYAEAKRYYDAHPEDRKRLSWDGDSRPCEDFVASWSR